MRYPQSMSLKAPESEHTVQPTRAFSWTFSRLAVHRPRNHGHGLSRGGALVQQGGIGHFHPGELTHQGPRRSVGLAFLVDPTVGTWTSGFRFLLTGC